VIQHQTALTGSAADECCGDVRSPGMTDWHNSPLRLCHDKYDDDMSTVKGCFAVISDACRTGMFSQSV